MKLYNPITKKNEELQVNNNTVKIYVCGPTVYDDLHIGNMRPVLVFDTLARFLSYCGYTVDFLSNITDIDDKIIKRALEEKKSEVVLANTYIKSYMKLLKSFNVVYPGTNIIKATSILEEMYAFIKDLINKGYAYEKNGSVYFNTLKANEYGLISGQDINSLKASAKADKLNDKEDVQDFSLWKKTDEGIQYDSPFGLGRPGWHTECSCMNYTYFKDSIDIHGGGIDLKFPHHENENAQFQALTGKMLAKFWMYTGFINLKDKKMSKSTGNLIKAKTLLEQYNPNAYRLLILAHSYHQPINFSDELMIQYQKEYNKIVSALQRKSLEYALLRVTSKEIDREVITQVNDYLNDNFNTPLVVSLVFEKIKQLNKESDPHTSIILYNTIYEILSKILGLNIHIKKLNKKELLLYRIWITLKNEKNFAEADKLRAKLVMLGIIE